MQVPVYRPVWTLAFGAVLLGIAAAGGGCAPWAPPPGTPTYVAPPPPLVTSPGSGAPLPGQVSVQVRPQQTAAVIGSTVPLVAEVHFGGRPLPGQRVDWVLAPQSVGRLDLATTGSPLARLLPPFTSPRKISDAHVITVTATRDQLWSRGTPNPGDDVTIRRGQAMVLLSSPQEGLSRVQVVVPGLAAAGTAQSAWVYWADARWTFPAPTEAPMGTSATLLTRVVRQSDGTPAAGYLVRYEVTGGTGALFSNGQRQMEVTTDANGEASVVLQQGAPLAGETQVQVELARMAGSPPRRFTLAKATTRVRWTSNVQLTVSGPQEASLGQTLTYEIQVRNQMQRKLDQLTITAPVPEALEYLSSTPRAEQSGSQLQWILRDLEPGQVQTIQVQAKVVAARSFQFCASLASDPRGGAARCVRTTVAAPQLKVELSGPTHVVPGQEAKLDITVRNLGAAVARGLLVTAHFDPGLTHQVGQSPIEGDLEDLPPGAARRVPLSFGVKEQGPWCVRVVVTGSGVRAEARHCFQVRSSARETSPAGVQVKVSGPSQLQVGQQSRFALDVINPTGQVLTNLGVSLRLGAELEPKLATQGHQLVQDGGYTLRWTLPRLGPGARVRYEVQALARKASSQACLKGQVQAGSTTARGEHCLKLLPAPGKVAVSIAALVEPTQVGKEVPYEIRITNTNNRPLARVVVEVEFPEQLQPVRIGTTGPTSYRIQGRRIIFEPLEQLAGLATQSYRVRAKAVQPGEAVVKVKVTTAADPQGTTAEETTTVFRREQ